MSKAVFSIVASNYLSLAVTLGNSVRKQHPDLPFFIILADKEDKTNGVAQPFTIIPVTELGVSNMEEMAFKYNVTEFCTALKPFGFAYLFEQGFDQVIYFDPDIYVFAPLKPIFERLSQTSLIVTPHICTMQNQYTGLVPEGMLLGVGIYNFGFCAFRSTKTGHQIIEWWQRRLAEQCYQDKFDGLHVDQKWMDFIPSMVDDVYIERGLGYNVAFWNWHERKIIDRDGSFWVAERFTGLGEMPLLFYHFSNYNFDKIADREAFMPVSIPQYNDCLSVSDFYRQRLLDENYEPQTVCRAYAFGYFADGTPIIHFQRRLFRRLIALGYRYENPFDTQAPNSFYRLLHRNKLLLKPSARSWFLDKSNELTYPDFNKNIARLQRLARLARRMLGFEQYALLCKFAQRFVRPENQTFLIDEVADKITFYNENRYINQDSLPD